MCRREEKVQEERRIVEGGRMSSTALHTRRSHLAVLRNPVEAFWASIASIEMYYMTHSLEHLTHRRTNLLSINVSRNDD